MKRILKDVLFIAILVCIVMVVMDNVYKKIGYGYFKKALSRSGVTFFTRDGTIKYTENNSYKIENKDYNNATFYKKVKINKNTPYKISCMIKTENVEVLNKTCKNSGAKICIIDHEEQSEAVIGTSDWKRVTLLFDSKENEELNIGFMLGGDTNTGNVKGKAWFSDLQIEEGSFDNDNNWKFACFVFKNTDVNLFNTEFKYAMTNEDINQITTCMERFKGSCQKLSSDKMTVSFKIIEIDTPITELTYDDSKGYYVDPENISKIIRPYMENENFDHVFVCCRLSDNNSCIPNKNWIGLGGMEYKGRGFSNIRMPTKSYNSKYTYDDKSNKFPEEVYVHEFLHTLEHNSKKYNYCVPALHDNEKYGYEYKSEDGLYRWYNDYMSCNIGEDKKGLNERLYILKPLDEENFKSSKKLNEFEDVKNILERFKLVIETINN